MTGTSSLVLLALLAFWGTAGGHGAIQYAVPRSTFTHPELCLPLSTGLIRTADVINTFFISTPRLRGPAFTLAVPDRVTYKRKRCMFCHLSEKAQNSESCGELFHLLFRSADGSCNNAGSRGQSLQPIARLLPPAFDDGVDHPRTLGAGGGPLPSPRSVSRAVHPDVQSTSDLTLFVMQWGQLMDHEMVSTPLPIEDTRGTITCCGSSNGVPVGPTEPADSECFPIIFPPNDPDFNGECMEFVRSQSFMFANGTFMVPRQNENLVTSFIDASTVYGSTQERQDMVRDTHNSHLLKMTSDNFLPDNGLDDCVKRNDSDICVLAGDERVNELPTLTFIHTVMARYHNVLARELREVNPLGDDEMTFQQARAIVAAVMQNILYSEWVPIVLGRSIRKQYRLDLHPYRRTRHKPKIDPTIFQAFSSATFRFGHTLIPRSIPLSPTRQPLLREVFFRPFEASENFDTLAQGMMDAQDPQHRTQQPDRFFVEEITKHLFENQEGERKAFDLITLNLQRGRDHGIPSYNAYRQLMGLGKIRSFNDPRLGTGGSHLAMVYSHVDDIDLFSGAMSEPAHEGGLVGETFSHLMATQLRSLKFGDRFFFDNARTGFFGFTNIQVKALRRVRLAHVLCMTTGITHAQKDVFRAPSRKNKQISCERFKRYHPKMHQFRRYPF